MSDQTIPGVLTHATTTQSPIHRTEYRDGKRYLVAPVVMMVEGVHAGSRGPVYHPRQALASSVPLWEGRPVTIRHPQDPDGNYISAQSEEAQRTIVGEVRNARMEEAKLKAELWLNEQRLLAVSPQALSHITQNLPLEVSTGVFSQDEAVAGEWNGEQYDSIAIQHEPDHLALLPGERGACSWQDGCGIRVNREQTKEGGNMPEDKQCLLEVLKQVKIHGLTVAKLQVNELGFRELASKVQRKLDRLDSEAKIHFLHDVYDEHFIYAVHDRDNETERHYRQTYTTNEQEEVEFTGDPVEVRKQVEFVEITTNSTVMKRTKKPNNNQTQEDMEKEKTPCGDCMEKVVGLINNERTRFTKADREWLLSLNEEQLDKLEPTEAPAPQVNREQALEVLREELADAEKLVGLLPGELKDQVEAGLTLHKEERTKLVKAIQANTEEGTWTPEELDGMSMPMLRKLAKSARKSDYSGNGGTGTVAAHGDTEKQDEEFLAPAGIEVE